MFSVSFRSVWSWVSGCGSTDDCSWNPLLYTSSSFLIPCSLSTASCRSDTCCRKSSTWVYFVQAGFLTVSDTRQKHRHFLQPEVCSAANPFGSSVCVEVPGSSRVDRADSLSGAAFLKMSVQHPL